MNYSATSEARILEDKILRTKLVECFPHFAMIARLAEQYASVPIEQYFTDQVIFEKFIDGKLDKTENLNDYDFIKRKQLIILHVNRYGELCLSGVLHDLNYLNSAELIKFTRGGIQAVRSEYPNNGEMMTQVKILQKCHKNFNAYFDFPTFPVLSHRLSVG